MNYTRTALFDISQKFIDDGVKLSHDKGDGRTEIQVYPRHFVEDMYVHPIGRGLTEPDGDSLLDKWEEELEYINPQVIRTSATLYMVTWALGEWIMAFERGETVFPIKVRADHVKTGLPYMGIHKLILSPDQMEMWQITERDINGGPPNFIDKKVSVEAATRGRRLKEQQTALEAFDKQQKQKKQGRKHSDQFDEVVELIRNDPSLLQGKTGRTLESVGLKANQYNRTTLNKRLKKEGLK